MAQIIQRALASVAFIVIAVLPMSPVVAQTQQQLNWCLHKDDAFSPALRIDGCTATIRSGRQSGKDLSRVFYNRAIAYAKKGQYDHAIADFDQAIRLDPDSIFALNNRGAAYARKGQYDDAIADFNEAIRIDASYAITYNNRGIAYAKKGQYDRAIEDFDQAIRFDPKDASALKNRSLAKRLMGNTVGANTEVANALKIRSLAEHMKESSPNTDAIEASALKNGSQVEQTNDNSPNTTTNDARPFPKRSAAKQLNGNTTDTDPKISAASKSRNLSSLTSKSRSKVQLASVRSHRSRPQSALVRFFGKHHLIPDFRKVFRLASRRNSSSPRTNY